MSAAQNQGVVDRIVVRSTEELFAAYEVEVTKMPDPDQGRVDDVGYVGVIGFTGKAMRGTLVLAPTRTLLLRAYPGASELRDWAGELANQLIGRIKTQLRRYGVEVHVTTPVIMRGQCLAFVPRSGPSLHCFAASPGNVSVWFDAELSDGVDLVLEDTPMGASEGEALLF